MLKVTPTVKTKRLNVITVKLDTHGTFAGTAVLKVLEVCAKYRFVLLKIREKTIETN